MFAAIFVVLTNAAFVAIAIALKSPPSYARARQKLHQLKSATEIAQKTACVNRPLGPLCLIKGVFSCSVYYVKGKYPKHTSRGLYLC